MPTYEQPGGSPIYSYPTAPTPPSNIAPITQSLSVGGDSKFFTPYASDDQMGGSMGIISLLMLFASFGRKEGDTDEFKNILSRLRRR